ncbi:MAG: bifunctional riboflavin kinase/FAD synthetase [Anaerolineae bacterium]|nr:bifunctional riboflavin kinase/FAD synthetase [Anaerolineae bacterium]
MQVIDDLATARVERPTVVTIGAFDGVHIGHQQLVRELVQHARQAGKLSAVVTFHPHPRAVLRPWLGPKVLTTPGEKAVLFAQMGLDILVLLRFSQEMAQTTAADFVAMLHERLRMDELWVGEDFALGRGREGNVPALRRMGAEQGFQVRVITPISMDGQVISSTWVRELLAQGQVDEARRLLGRPYSLAGEVVLGARRGRCLGFPTANLAVRQERAVPPDGVYAVYALIGEERWPAVANVGERPSFNSGVWAIEVHIIGYDGDLYGRDLVIEFVKRLRAERRFTDICELVGQIGRDVEEAKRLFAAEAVDTREEHGERVS